MTNAQQIVPQLCTNILFKRRIHPVHITGKHCILPDDQAKAIAGVVEPIIGIVATAPYADCVEVGSGAILQKTQRLLGRNSRDYTVLGYIVSSHGEYLDTIDPKTEFLTPFILITAYRQLPQTNLLVPVIQHLTIFVMQFHIQSIQRLLAIRVRPPQLRRFQHERYRCCFLCGHTLCI